MKLEYILSKAVEIECPDETYTIASDGTIYITNIQNKGDCVHDNMERIGLRFSTIKYSSKSDSIAVIAWIGTMSETLIFHKVSNALIAPAASKSTDFNPVTEVSAVEKRPIKILSNREYRKNAFKNL